jgi:hypothetical protein
MKKTALCISIAVGTTFAFAQPKDSKPAPPPKDAPKDAPKDIKKPEPPAMPTPSKDLDAAKGFAKAWICQGTMGEAATKVAAKFTMKRDLDNFWYSVRFEVPKSKAGPGFIGMAMVGIDPESKGWIVSGFDNHGGMIKMKATLSAGSMTWEGDALGEPMGKVAAKMTFTVDDKKKLKFIGEFGGKKAFEHDCR